MKLYEAESPNALRVWVFMAEKGIEIPRVPVDLFKGGNLAEDYLAKNPMGRVPVLELDDGSYLSESVAICRYLEGVQPEPNLFGKDALDMARIEMWNRRAEINFFGNVAMAFRNLTGIFKDRETCVPEWGKVAAEEARNKLGVFETRLGESEYVAGDRFTIADITLAVAIRFAERVQGMGNFDVEIARPHIERWLDVVVKRPSFANR